MMQVRPNKPIRERVREAVDRNRSLLERRVQAGSSGAPVTGYAALMDALDELCVRAVRLETIAKDLDDQSVWKCSDELRARLDRLRQDVRRRMEAPQTEGTEPLEPAKRRSDPSL